MPINVFLTVVKPTVWRAYYPRSWACLARLTPKPRSPAGCCRDSEAGRGCLRRGWPSCAACTPFLLGSPV